VIFNNSDHKFEHGYVQIENAHKCNAKLSELVALCPFSLDIQKSDQLIEPLYRELCLILSLSEE